MSPGIDISIIIPAYNEESRLRAGFDRLRPTLDVLDPQRLEVIVIDDGSNDKTMLHAHEVYGHLANTQFIQQPSNLGKGAAIKLGIAAARGEHLITADADMAIDPRHFPAFDVALGSSDVVPGSRAVNGRIRYDSLLRTYAGAAFNVIVRHYTKTEIRDTQCGCKGFRRGPARLLALLAMVDRFAFDAEMLYLAHRLGLRVEPLTVDWEDIKGSSVRVAHDSLEMLRDIRGLSRTAYENPVVVLERDVQGQSIVAPAREARLSGLVLARGPVDTLLVLPRDGSLGGLGVASVMGAQLRTARLEELEQRTYEAV
ncbi:MAG: glycosyltransferase [Acidimicrobiaceae bacterium]|nr:glycosyltransferase [Acidimicrobiaceae bacterium]